MIVITDRDDEGRVDEEGEGDDGSLDVDASSVLASEVGGCGIDYRTLYDGDIAVYQWWPGCHWTRNGRPDDWGKTRLARMRNW